MLHKDVVDENLHAAGTISSSDPGDIGAGKIWYDSSLGTGNWHVKIRNAANTGWEEVDSKTHTHTESQITDLQAYLTEADADLLYSLLAHTHLEADITDLGNYSSVGHGHVEADISDLDHDATKLQGDDIRSDMDGPYHNQVLMWDDANSRWDADDIPDPPDMRYFHALAVWNTGPDTPVDTEMNWTKEIKSDWGFTHSETVNPEEITLDSEGWYKITVDIGMELASSEDGWFEIRADLQYNDGTGWEDNIGSRLRLTGNGSLSEDWAASGTWMFRTGGFGWKIRIRLDEYSGGTTRDAYGDHDHNRITIERLIQ